MIFGTMQRTNAAPILYSFRRCPYAMRARMALDVSKIDVEHREVLLRDKPAAMLEASPKGTVPVLVLAESVIEQSLDLMLWALHQRDPEGWLSQEDQSISWLGRVETEFKPNLDGYKYGHRGALEDEKRCRDRAVAFLEGLETQLADGHALGNDRTLADVGSFPFVRQFAHHDREFFSSLGLRRIERWLSDFLESERFQRVMEKRPVWKPAEELSVGLDAT